MSKKSDASGKRDQICMFSTVRRRPRVSFETGTESRVQQSFKNDSDINVIMRRYEEGGELPESLSRSSFFGDVSGIGDFREAHAAVARGRVLFAALPAGLRDRFHNDVGAFLDFAENPANAEELSALGFGVKPTDKEPKAPEVPKAKPKGVFKKDVPLGSPEALEGAPLKD